MVTRVLATVNDIPQNARVVLYGAGGLGRYARAQIAEKRSDVDLVGFLDVSRSGEVDGLAIYTISVLPAVDWILITTSYWKNAEENLRRLGTRNYLIFDPFYEPPLEQVAVQVSDVAIASYAPNNVLRMLAESFSTIEPGTLAWIDTFSHGDVFYDIGASNGMFGLYAAIKRACQVMAFEPDAQNYAVTDTNSFLNRAHIAQPFYLFNLALGSGPHLVELHCVRHGPGHHDKIVATASHRSNGLSPTSEHVQHVITDSLDEFVMRYGLPEPNHIKIDVDGAECAVLRGARRLLSSPQVRSLLIELSERDELFDDLLGQLQGFGFRVAERQAIREIIGTPVEHVFNFLFVR